jgi:membrane protease YdiL (CAAX protease family)
MEELFFRAYLLQGLSSGSRRVAPAIIVSSLLFALMHSWNPEVQTHGFFVMFPFYFSFGLFLAIIAVLDQSLEIPLAVHAANNIYGALVVTFPESALQTDALWTVRNMNPVESYPFLYAGILFFCLLMYVRYRWNNFSDLLA